jgi:hypothetical protein
MLYSCRTVYIPQINPCRAPRDPCRRQACIIYYLSFICWFSGIYPVVHQPRIMQKVCNCLTVFVYPTILQPRLWQKEQIQNYALCYKVWAKVRQDMTTVPVIHSDLADLLWNILGCSSVGLVQTVVHLTLFQKSNQFTIISFSQLDFSFQLLLVPYLGPLLGRLTFYHAFKLRYVNFFIEFCIADNRDKISHKFGFPRSGKVLEFWKKIQGPWKGLEFCDFSDKVRKSLENCHLVKKCAIVVIQEP